MALMPRDAERWASQRDLTLQPRQAVARLRGRATEMADLSREGTQKSAIELAMGAVEQQRRLAEPRHDPPRDHVRTPSDRIMGTADRHPLVDERARVGAADARVGSPQIAQPAEAEKRGRRLIGRRRD